MIKSLFAKLFGCMLGNKINKWREESDKNAKGQAILDLNIPLLIMV